MNATLILVRGIPGSGKSYITAALADAFGQQNTVVLDPDKINKDGTAFQEYSRQLIADGVDEKFHPFRFLRQTGYDGISAGQTVIWNQAFNDFNGFEITIKRMQEYADAHDVALKVLVVEVEIDPKVARMRIDARAAAGEHDVEQERFESFVSGYESFVGRGYQTITVNGADDTDGIISVIKDKLASL